MLVLYQYFQARRQKMWMFVCLVLDKRFDNSFSQGISDCHRDNIKGKTYQAMDLPVYGESDSANFVSVEN